MVYHPPKSCADYFCIFVLLIHIYSFLNISFILTSINFWMHRIKAYHFLKYQNYISFYVLYLCISSTCLLLNSSKSDLFNSKSSWNTLQSLFSWFIIVRTIRISILSYLNIAEWSFLILCFMKKINCES